MNKVKAFLQNRSFGGYLKLAANALWLATLIFYLAYSGAVGLIHPLVTLLICAGLIVSCLTTILDVPLISFLEPVLFTLAFAFYIDERVEMFAYMSSGIYGISGETTAIIQCVVAILILMLVCIVLSITSSFMNKQKEILKS